MVFDRYLFKSVLVATLFMTMTLAVLILLTQSLRFLELVIESGASSSVFWVLTLLALPRFFEVVVPIALMGATLFTYNRLLMDSEVVVMRAAGYSPMRLARPALVLSLIVTCFLLFVTMWLAPTSLGAMQNLRQVIKAQYSTLLIKEGIFNEFGDHLTVYVEDRTREGELHGIMIHDTNPKWENPVTIIAKRGVIVTSDAGQQVFVYDGWRQDFNPQSGVLNKLSFDRYSIDLPESGEVRQRWAEPDERTFFELLNPDLSEKRDFENQRDFIYEAHRRIISPFLAPAFVFIALGVLLLGPMNRRGLSLRIVVAVMSVIVLEALYLTAFNFSSHSALGLVFMYVIVFVPIAAGFFALGSFSEGVRRQMFFSNKARAA